jgi:D-3-phosphoglycerate dehydrogenase
MPRAASRQRVLVTWPGYARDDPAIGRRLDEVGLVPHLAPKRGPRSDDDFVDLARGSVAAIVSTDRVTAEILDALPQLRIVARCGVGLDTIDVDAATNRGVLVTTARGANEEAVADHTVGLMLALLRRLIPDDRLVRSGAWSRDRPFLASDLHGKTVGLLGLGAIGRAVARRLAGFDVRLLAHDPAVASGAGEVMLVALPELLGESDVVTLHLPLLAETWGLIGGPELARMKRGAILVNTSRGEIVDEAALADALRSGHLAGAGIDVFEHEPPAESPLLRLGDRVVLTPHVAGLTRESVRAMQISATTSVVDLFAGRWPRGVANPEVRRTLTHSWRQPS